MSRSRKARAEFTAAEVEELLSALSSHRIYRSNFEVRDGRGPTIRRIEQKLWDLYAETHPEDGPFK